MTTIDPLPDTATPLFKDRLTESIMRHQIAYIVPTTSAARAYFKAQGTEFNVLDTSYMSPLPSVPVEGDVILDAYSDKTATPLFIGCRSIRNKEGHSFWETIKTPAKLKSLAIDTAQKHRLKGAWSLTVDTQHNLTGIHAFITPEMALYRAIGVNFILLMLHEARGNSVSVLATDMPARAQTIFPYKTSLTTKYKTVFLDLDDTLITHGSINKTAMAFIHQCKEKAIPVYLITRHYRDPEITLHEYGVNAALFKGIIWITDDTPKSAHIKNAPEPIFIDDAFSERQEVGMSIKVPCIAPDALEALMIKS